MKHTKKKKKTYQDTSNPFDQVLKGRDKVE